MKVCSKCKIEKDERLFPKNKKYRDGLWSYCRDCKRDTDREWNIKNRDKRLLYSKKRRSEHKEEVAKSKKIYVENNRDKVRKWQRQYWKSKKEHLNREMRKRRKIYVDSLTDSYVISKLKRQGYSKDQIEEMPAVLDVKKLEILIYRANKLKKQKS